MECHSVTDQPSTRVGACATFLALVVYSAVGCGGPNAEPPGNPDVYARIESSADCTALQAEFDVAMENVERRQPGDDYRRISLAYADAADRRMRTVGCYR